MVLTLRKEKPRLGKSANAQNARLILSTRFKSLISGGKSTVGTLRDILAARIL